MIPIHYQKKKKLKWGFPIQTAGRSAKTNNGNGGFCLVSMVKNRKLSDIDKTALEKLSSKV